MPLDKTRSQTLLTVLERLGRPRLLVVGDLILDRYTWGNAQRISPEAPVLVLNADRREERLGGAASVGLLARGLEAEVAIVGTVGGDLDGRAIRTLLEKAGIDDAGVVDVAGRRSTVKERFIGRAASRHPQQILRVDHEERLPATDEVTDKLHALLTIHVADCDAVLISDYDKGVCTHAVLQALLNVAAARSVPVVVDPARVSDYSRYRGASVVTPNRLETQLATGIAIDGSEDALQAGRALCERFGIGTAVITLDRDGMAVVTDDGIAELFPTDVRDVYDITGAGDMVLATLGVCIAAGTSLAHAVQLANVAAGLEVERVGVEQISRAEIRADLHGNGKGTAGRVVTVDELAELAESLKRRGKTIAFTNGCFDILHRGHRKCLREAAAMADVLVVGVNSDDSVRRLKGADRPVNREIDRAELLAEFGCVDYVVIFGDDTPHQLLKMLRPDVLVKGGTYTVAEVIGREVVEEYGGKVCVTGRIDGVSTTQILNAGRQTLRSSEGGDE